MLSFLFDEVNRVITVSGDPLPTEVTCQEIVNAIRDWEDELDNMDCPQVATASGKDDLGGNLAVGITLKLLNWKVKFADRGGSDFVTCTISGGNLIAVDADGQPVEPTAPAAYVNTVRAVAVSAARIADVAEWTQTEKDTLGDNLLRTLGLTQENFYIDQTAYDSDGNLTSARVRIYASAGDVPDGEPIATYLSWSTYVNKRLQTYSVKKQ